MAGRQSEPSIDEILSSIRKVIAEDDAHDSLPSVSESRNKGSDDILELTSVDENTISSENIGDVVSDEALVDHTTAKGLRQSLSTLAALSEPSAPPQIVRSGETSLESLVTEMLRPMMKEWLDQNLPTLVESMVEREIKRITKKS